MGDREEKRYKELVENLNDAVYTVNVPGLVFTSVNSAGERLTGYKRSELLTMSITKLIAPEFLKLVRTMINRKRKKAQSTIYEIEIVRKDGRRVPVEISSIAIYGNNLPVEILGVARDITERKMMERQRNVFISLITHEIKNPLTSAILFLNLVQKRLKKDKTGLSYASTISAQMNSINRLLSDFLDITQMRVGKFQINKGQFDFNQVIVDVVKNFQGTRRIMVNGPPSKKIMGDKIRIRQVLTNLLSNAIKYSPQGKEINITVSEKAGKVTLGVQDFGQGIAKSDQKQLFDLFFRTKDSAKSEIQGHGLGLYICREIIKLHKGKLWVESSPGKGSTFFFSIPN